MTQETPKNAVALTGLRKTYAGHRGGPQKEALRGLDLGIPAGSIFGLLGPNGAGKSTTINILAGLVTKTSGKVEIWGFDQDVNPRQSRASIGIVPQELNIDPFFSPRAALEVQAGLYGVPRHQRRTDEILDAVGLLEKANAYARTLSGGMQRRLLIAKALVHAPPVLVLDEPTAGVDIALRQMLWSYVRDLNAAGTTIILTTHYLEEAQEMCDRIAIIDQGNLVACDETANLLARLDNKRLVITTQIPLSAPPALPDGATAILKDDRTLVVRYRRGKIRVEDLLDCLRAADISILDITTKEADLAEVFVSLTGGAPDAGTD